MINEIQSGRLNAILHKLLALKEGAPSPSLATDVFPMLGLEMDRPEWKYLGGEVLVSGWGAKSPVAGEFGNVTLENASGSGALIVLEQIGISIATAGQVEIFPLHTASGLTNVSSRYARDLRWDNPTGTFFKQATGIIRQGDLTPISPSNAYFYPLAGTSCLYPVEYVIPPGRGISVRAATANIALRVWFVWRERSLEQSETR